MLRGKYVLENLLASPPPPPPPNVPSLKTEGAKSGEAAFAARSDDAASRRSGLRELPRAHGSHRIRLENFDAIGRWRDHDGRQAASMSSSTLPDGTVVDGVAGVKKLILKDPERFVGAMTEKLLMYGIGRNVQYFDAPAVRQDRPRRRREQLQVCIAGAGRGQERPIPDAEPCKAERKNP